MIVLLNQTINPNVNNLFLINQPAQKLVGNISNLFCYDFWYFIKMDYIPLSDIIEMLTFLVNNKLRISSNVTVFQVSLIFMLGSFTSRFQFSLSQLMIYPSMFPLFFARKPFTFSLNSHT